MSFINRFRDATIGFSGYARLLRDRAGAFGYMSVLLLIVLAIAAWITTVRTEAQLTQAARDLEKVPDFQVSNGEFTFSGNMPHRSSIGGITVIFDTTGTTTEALLAKEPPGTLLVTRDKIYQVSLPGYTQVRDLAILSGATLGKKDVSTILSGVHRTIPYVFVLIYVFQLGFKAIDATLLALVAQAAARRRGRPVSFDLAFKLGTYAMTMPILIQWLAPNFTTLSIGGIVVWWGIAILYTVRGLKAYFEPEPQEI
jgi:hypothetical protein